MCRGRNNQWGMHCGGCTVCAGGGITSGACIVGDVLYVQGEE